MASLRRRRGRPPYPEILTPSEQRVLELIREGKTNSEIANELAISVPGVKYHVTNMLGKLEVEDRVALANWQGEASHENRRGLRGALASFPGPVFVKVGAILVCVAGIGGIAGLALGGHEDSSSEQAPDIPPGYSSMDPDRLAALGLVDLGPILRSPTGDTPVLAGQVRDSLGVVLLNGPAKLIQGSGQLWTLQFGAVVPNWIQLSGPGADHQLDVQLWAESMALSESTVVTVRPDGVWEISSKTGGVPPELLLSVREINSGRPRRAAIGTNGHLFVASSPIPGSVVLDNWTGVALDVRSSFQGHQLPGSAGLFQFTGCGDDGTCYVSLRTAEPLTAPVSGRLRCSSPSQLEIDHGDFVVIVTQVDTGYGSSPNFSCDEHEVAAGEVIGPAATHWVYTAKASNGEKISVGVSFDGSFYVGRFAPSVGCPCRNGT
ncbi:MAG: response regulator transcription factor [Dehalococcoidia bacterium]